MEIFSRYKVRYHGKFFQQKNAPDWLTRPIFGCLSTIVSRPSITVDPRPAGDLERWCFIVVLSY